uniref:Uncharacterized protein n=1 Tax=uncultured Chloroflexota bacterium TaxID=166587 RepID=H5SDX9_9CHLR|nr:hypothetical protein HGMM_F14G08C15 [uncultured Chloroflexota bacterium]
MHKPSSLPLDDLEARLHRVLRPIPAPMERLERVRQRIRYSPPFVATHRLFEWEFWFIVIGSLVTLSILLLTLARALFYLLGKK